MAVNTTLATIQMRRGLEQDFDEDQLAAGEWAVSTDKKYVRMCFMPGLVVRMATYEAFEEDMKQIQDILAECEDIQAAVDAMAKLAENHKNDAAASATAALNSATSAESSATTATQKATAAATSATNAANSAETATQKANAAGTSATNAENSATSASNSAKTATEKATAAANSAASAASSASTATSKASDASASAANADTYAKKSQSYAVGGTGTREGENSDNAKYYYEQSKNISQGLSGTLIPMGTVSFASLPALFDVENGWMYNVSDQFTTTSDFNEGAGKVIPAGANVYKTADGKWDVLAGTPVTTVNGQTGNVAVNLGNIEGTLPISKGGTGKTTAEDALNVLTKAALVENETYEFKDNDSILWRNTSGTNVSLIKTYRTKLTKLWNYMNEKAKSVFVKKSGDTMTGNLYVHKTDSYNATVDVQGKTDTKVGLQIGAGGINHGIWSYPLNKWMVYGDAANVYLNGTAEKAKKDENGKNINSEYFLKSRENIEYTDLDTFVSRLPGLYGVIRRLSNGDTDASNLLVCLARNGGSCSAFEIYVPFSGTSIKVRTVIDNKMYSDWHTLAFTSDLTSINTEITNLKTPVTKDKNGLVPAGDGHPNQIFGTDAEGNPGWMDNGNISGGDFASKEIYGDTAISNGRIGNVGQKSIAYGDNSTASGFESLSIGQKNTSSGVRAISFGFSNISSGMNCLASGANNIAMGNSSCCIGSSTISVDNYSDALGAGNIAAGLCSYAEGSQNVAGAKYIFDGISVYDAASKKFNITHARDNYSEILSALEVGSRLFVRNIVYINDAYVFTISSVENISTHIRRVTVKENIPTSNFSPYRPTLIKSGINTGDCHVEGRLNEATGLYSHAGGNYTGAFGTCSQSGGQYSYAYGDYSYAYGIGARAYNDVEYVIGSYSKKTNYNNRFIVGKGISDDNESNAFRVDDSGRVYGASNYNSSGADYAEYFEWEDGNKSNEDRVGFFVTVKGGLLHKANSGDYIIGITSGNPSVIGNSDEDYYWRWERDEFNRIIYDQVKELKEKYDNEGNVVIDEETGNPVMIETGRILSVPKQSINYDLSKQSDYIERKDRPEWDAVGMVGVLPVRDDGTCELGKFCRCTDGGIATLAEERGFDTYMVIERVSENIVSVVLK